MLKTCVCNLFSFLSCIETGQSFCNVFTGIRGAGTWGLLSGLLKMSV